MNKILDEKKRVNNNNNKMIFKTNINPLLSSI